MGNSRRLLFYLLTALAALCCAPGLALAQTSQRGEPGVAVRGSSVSFEKFARQEELAPQTAAPVEPAAIQPPKELPEADAGDSELVVREQPGANGPDEITGPLAPSPAMAASFLGSDMSSSIPPDTNGAVGPNHLMISVNGRVRIQRRDGSLVSTTAGLTAFFGNLGSPNTRGLTINRSAFDPRIFYDHLAGRWIIVAATDSRAASSSVVVAISQTSDPTGAWNFYQADADSADASWADYPSVGFNKDWIVVQSNMYSFSQTDPNVASTFTGSNLWVFNKANLYAGAAGTFTKFARAGGIGTWAPAVTFDNALPTMYLVANRSSAGGQLQMFTVTGPVGSELLTDSFRPTASADGIWSASPTGEDFAPQLDSTRKIQTNDVRMQSVVYRDGSLWCAHTIFLPATGGATRSSVQWWEINPVTGGVIQRGRVDDPTGANFYAFPSIAVNKNRDVLLGYSRFSAAQYVSANYAFHAAADPPGTLRDDTVLKAGEGPYDRMLSGDRNRWGDYSSAVVDPANDTDMWTLQEFAAAPVGTGTDSGRWGVWWGKLALAPVAPTPASVRLNLQTTPAVSEAAGRVEINVIRSGDVSAAVQVDYATSDGTASERSDYSAASGTLAFAPGETSKVITVFVTNDAYVEGAETFNLTLSNPRNGVLDTPFTVNVQINSDDVSGAINPVRAETFNPSFFVTQHYRDFFNRDPDAPGLAFWTGQTTGCGSADLLVCRINVSAAFFLSIEFQETGYLVYKTYGAAFGTRRVGGTVPLTLREFLPDTQAIGAGVIVNQGAWQQQLEANKAAYFDEFVSRPQFVAQYPVSISAAQFVDTLNANTGGSLSQAERDDLVNRLSAGQLNRAQVLRAVAENAAFDAREKNRAFVLMQYFGYLRRNPSDAPEATLDFAGYNFWLTKLNQFGGNFVAAEMVKAFITSTEYRARFGLP